MAASASGGIIGSAQTDVTNPYETIPCGCIYCFVCLVQKLEGEEGEGWVCLRCGEIVTKCKPWSGDVLENTRSQSNTGKMVGFVVDEKRDSDSAENETEAETETDEDGSDTATESPSPLEEITKDASLFHSSEWSTVDRESGDESS